MTAAANRFDAIVVGGGPAGSACARLLTRGGLKVAVIDRRRFPRVKLCAGWLSPPVWDVLDLSPREYPAGLWEWRRCHVQYAGRRYTLPARGHFIRRCEFDHFLVKRSGAAVVDGHTVKTLVRSDGDWVVDETFRARLLIGAGGTHCPVARALFPRKGDRPVAVQEHEFEAGAGAVAATRIGADGEPELLLHDDLGGYSWNVPKGEWLNVGTGTAAPREVLAAWAAARGYFLGAGHVPAGASAMLDHAAGHSYYLFDPAHLDACHRDGAFLVGDALGLAHPLTAEGILPAVVSGRTCAEAILAGAPEAYRARLDSHPVIRDYALARELLQVGTELKDRFGASAPQWLSVASRAATARGFAWMFGGRPIPYARALRGAITALQSLRRHHVEPDQDPSADVRQPRRADGT